MKVLALGGSGGMGRFAVATCMAFDNISEVIVADINADAAIAHAAKKSVLVKRYTNHESRAF